MNAERTINTEQAEAMMRLLIDSGDMTPMARLQLRKLWAAPASPSTEEPEQ